MNNAINPIALVVMKLLIEKGSEVAELFVLESLVPDAEKARLEFERLQADVALARSMINLARTESISEFHNAMKVAAANTEAALASTKDALIAHRTEFARREQILAIAEEIHAKSGSVGTDQIIEVLAERGSPLPGARPGTAIGNILFRSPGWTRIGEGKYQKRPGADLA